MTLSTLLGIFAQTEAAATPGFEGIAGQVLIMALLFGGMWFLIIAPQRKKQKQQGQMIESLKAGDEILTVGGLYGTITNRKDDRLVVKIADNTKIELHKSFVQSKVEGGGGSAESAKPSCGC